MRRKKGREAEKCDGEERKKEVEYRTFFPLPSRSTALAVRRCSSIFFKFSVNISTS